MSSLVRRAGAAALLLALAGAGVAGCEASGPGDASSGTHTARAADVVAPHAGHYAVAQPGPHVTSTPQVSAGGYQVVSAGDPVAVDLPGAEGTVLASGPDITLPSFAPGQPIAGSSAPGVLTVTATVTSGSLTLSRSSFLGLDEEQDSYALDASADSVTATPGHPATLQLHSTFPEGHTTVTWQPLGHPLVTWDFVVEID